MSFWNTRGRTLTAAAALSVLLVTSCDLMPGGEQESAGDEQNGAGTEPQGDGGAETGGQDDDGSEDSAEGTGADADSDDDAFASAELSDVAGNSVGEVRFSDADDAGVMVDIELWDINPGFRAVTLHEEGVCEPQSSNEAGEVGDYFSSGDVLPGTGSGEAGVVEGEDELETEDPDAETDGEEQEEGLGEAEDGAEADGVSTSLEGYPEGSVEGHTAAQVTDPGEAGDEDEDIMHPDRAGDLPNVFVMESGEGQMSFVSDRLSESLLTETEGTSVILRGEPTHHGSLPQRYAPYGPDETSQITGDLGERTACGVIE